MNVYRQYSAVIIFLFYALLLLRFVSDSFNSSQINMIINLALLGISLVAIFASNMPLLKSEFKYLCTSCISLITLFLLNIIFDLSFSVAEFLRLAYLALMINVLYLLFNRGFFGSTFNAFILITSILIALGFINIAFGNYRYVEGVMRLNGTYSHPNPYGMHLILITMLAFGMFYTGLNKKAMCCLGLAAFIVFTQIFNFSSLLALVVFIGMYFFFENRHKWVLAHYGLFLAAASIGFYLLYLISPVLNDRVNLLINTGLISEVGYAENSIQWRIMNWGYYLNNIDNLFLGNGVGSSDYFYKMRHYTSFTVLAPHNEWLKILFEYGVLGFVFLIYVLSKILLRVSHLSKALLLAFAFACFFDNFFKSTALIVLVTLLILFLEGGRRKYE